MYSDALFTYNDICIKNIFSIKINNTIFIENEINIWKARN